MNTGEASRLANWPAEARAECAQLVQLALIEDLADGVDCTTSAIVDPSKTARAAFVSREEGVLCGLLPLQLAVEAHSSQAQLNVELAEGEWMEPGATIASLEGPARDILTVERTCLNFLGRLSGIATLTKRFVDRVSGTSAKILDTRKTTPGWRHLEKYAVRCGGGWNHRIGLYDAVLIKDNHLAFASERIPANQAIPWAIGRARRWIEENAEKLPYGRETTLEVEVDDLQQLERVLSLPVDIVLLDNFSLDALGRAVELRNELQPKIQLEASGGVNLETVGKIALTGVDRISVGALTHSALNLDIALDWLGNRLSQ